jgi:UDP-glucose 4-epimerase
LISKKIGKILCKRIFITGGAGFFGSNFVKKFLKTSVGKITIYDNFSNGRLDFLGDSIKDDRLAIVKGDVLNYDHLCSEMSGHDIVIHLSANADIAQSAIDVELDLRQSVLATFNVLQAIKSNKITRLVYSSGSGVYGDIKEFAPSENFGPLLPVSMYGATKLGAEALISAFSHLFGINATIFRFANIVGPNQTHGVAYDFIHKLRQTCGTSLQVLGNGNQSKSYIHINDVLDAIDLILKLNQAGVEIYNLGTGDYISVKEIAQLVVHCMGFEGTKIYYGSTAYGWSGDVPIVRLDDSKIRNLGWQPQYGSAAAIKKSIIEMIGKPAK